MNLKTLRPHLLPLCGLAATLLLPPLAAHAAVITDDFSTAHDYQLGDTTGTVWTGMHNIPLLAGTGLFEAAGGTLHVEDNGANVGWEGGRSTAPLLYSTVPAGQDFTATVKISAQTSGFWSAAGLIARAQNATLPGIPPDHNAQNFVTMTSFRTNAANADEGVTLLKRIQAGAQLNDLGISINGTTPVNVAPLPILVRMERVNGGTTYRGFVSEDNGATWQFQSRVRPDAGNALQDPAVAMEVGLSYMNFGTLVGAAELDDFVLDTYAPKPAPGAPTLGNANSLNITATRGDVVVVSGFKDLSGLNAETMAWTLIANPANPATPPTMTTTRVTPALLPGGNGGETAVADALAAPLPVQLAQDGSTLFRWNTNVAQAPNPPNTGMLPAQPWALGTYQWTIRATNDWLQVSNDLTLTVTLIPEPSTVALGGMAFVALARVVQRRRR